MRTLKSIARLLPLLAPVLVGLLGARLLTPFLPEITRVVGDTGAWAPVVFVLVYVAVVVVMLPAFMVIIVGGAVFGFAKGALLSMIGATLGGIIAFLIARHFARDLVLHRIAKHPALQSIDRVVGDSGMKIVFLLRLSQAVPYVLSNYALGVTRVRLRDFVVGTIGLVPTVLSFTAYGSASNAFGGTGAPTTSPWVVGLSITATVVLALVLGRIAKRALSAADATSGSPTAAAP
ncbi:MAG TPA: VTT domain-containing protein [Gemmatimonas sp.]|nr:VTT domain-containing protein [Gemmatimonas sp.]